MSTQYTLKSKDVAGQLSHTKEWVRLHSRFENPVEPVIPAVKVLGRYRWSQSDVDEFISANTVTKTPKD
jgi:hypothetical protein